MANLYDLELQESNNFIHLLLQNGQSAALKLFEEQKEMSAAMGPAGAELIKGLEDESTELGKNYKRLQDLEKDVQKIMQANGMTADLANKANDIFRRTPSSLDDLDDKERTTIKDYWIKKKMCVSSLVQKGYTYQEIFS